MMKSSMGLIGFLGVVAGPTLNRVAWRQTGDEVIPHFRLTTWGSDLQKIKSRHCNNFLTSYAYNISAQEMWKNRRLKAGSMKGLF